MAIHDSLSLLFTVTAFIFSAPTAHAELTDPNSSCGVPICDMQNTLSEFQRANAGEQYATLRRYTVLANTSDKSAVLTNLGAFAEGARAILAEINADKLLVDAAAQISTITTIGLARYSELNADLLLGFFKRIQNEGNRFEILNAWTLRLKEYEDKPSLLELSRFFAEAGKHCKTLEDDEYIVELAKNSEQAAAKKLQRLQPIYEGVYTVRVTCAGNSRCAASRADKLVIVDPLVGDFLEADLIVGGLHTFIHKFQNVAVSGGGTVLEGIARNGATGALAKIHLDYDLELRSFSGTIESPDETLIISGTQDQDASVVRLFDFQIRHPVAHPVPKALFDHNFTGTFRGKKVTFKINTFTDELVGATMSFDDLPNFKLRFHAGRLFPKSGLLLLVSNPFIGGVLKMALTINESAPGKYVVEGFAFGSESAVVNQIDLQGAL